MWNRFWFSPINYIKKIKDEYDVIAMLSNRGAWNCDVSRDIRNDADSSLLTCWLFDGSSQNHKQ